MQQHIPADKLSRVSAYDWMGSLAFFPLGLLVAGPVAGRIGTATTLWVSAAWMIISTCAVLLIPGVRNLRRLDGQTTDPDNNLATLRPEPSHT